jgi:hypothetical protein
MRSVSSAGQNTCQTKEPQHALPGTTHHKPPTEQHSVMSGQPAYQRHCKCDPEHMLASSTPSVPTVTAAACSESMKHALTATQLATNATGITSLQRNSSSSTGLHRSWLHSCA